MVKFPELLIDRLYRQTFLKAHRNPDLRRHLEDARRFVLDDAMTRFLVELTFQSFTARAARSRKHLAKPKYERLFKLLDDIRHFSRLPHRVTWVEYSHEAYMRRELEIFDEYDIELRIQPHAFTETQEVIDADLKAEEWLKLSKGQRIGWLFTSHQKIETAFSCSVFSATSPTSTVSLSNASYCWDTDDNPLPWKIIEPRPSRGYNTGSEKATHIRGYVRPNVGFRIMVARLPTESNDEFHRSCQEHIDGLGGLLRYNWMFLSTVNKIPLAGARVVKPTHGFVARGSYRKFLSHSVITLSVPQKNIGLAARKVLGDIIRRRAHQVRGHWRDDWRLPKGNKSLWIAEHQRGDASLGFVTHDYVVQHEE